MVHGRWGINSQGPEAVPGHEVREVLKNIVRVYRWFQVDKRSGWTVMKLKPILSSVQHKHELQVELEGSRTSTEFR
jgi:hypothetical protein